MGTVVQRHGRSRSSESSRLPSPQGPLSYDNRPSFLSQPTVQLRGQETPPAPSSIATSFPPAEIYLLLCCPSSLPQVQCWGGLHGATPSGESGESCVHGKKGSPLPVSCPFLAGLLEPQRTAHGCQSVEEVSRNGNFPGSKSGCQMTAPLEHPFPGRPGLLSILHTEDKACTGPCGWRARKTLASVPP